MSILRQFTTRSYTVRLEKLDLTPYDVYVSVRQYDIEVFKSNPLLTLDGTDTLVTFSLTQEESGQFQERPGAIIQINWTWGDDMRDACAEVPIPVRGNLHREVIHHGN